MKLIDILKYRRIIFSIFFAVLFFNMMLLTTEIYPRGNGNGYSFWNFNYARGYIGFESNYYYLNTTLGTGFNEVQKSSQFNGSFSLDTKSSIVHPNFLELELNALFRPGTRNDNFIVAPDQSAVTTAERVGFRTNLFKQRPLNASFYFNYDHSFVRRDFATNIENFRKNVGAFVYFRSYFANFNFNYNYDDWLQDELDLNRFYASKIHNFRTDITQSFGKNYDNKLTFNYGDFYRKYSYNDLIIANKVFDANLNTKFLVEMFVPVRYYSLISYNKQVGYDNRNKFNVNQSLFSQLPYNLKFNAGYNYNYLKVDLFTSDINKVNLGLNHQLYSSLNTFVNIELTNYKQHLYNEKTNEFKVGFDYTKNIPIGNLKLSYSYSQFRRSTESNTNVNVVYSEPHKLADGEIELLNNPNVFEKTIVVTDEKNVIVFQEGFDYEIIDYGEFFEIRRIPGGQIPNNGLVLVNYSFLMDNSYKFTSPNHHFSVGLNLFNNFIQFSYSGIEVNYNNLENVRYLVLKWVSQRILSLIFNYAGFKTGMEFNSYKTNIVPYESVRYFGQYDYLLEETALFSLIANYKTLFLTAQNQRQIFKDVVGRIMLFLGRQSKLLLEGSYRFQRGLGIDLDLLKFKTEYQLNFRAVQISVGVELFDRTYIQERKQYMNGYISLQRNF
ncbi:hypothetical protein MNBD_IGNAVI01-90 [hydrothermal vent metagenome]|uniref:Outer membrane protein beta-barrel domain-containing protein n=1 Tax=hydrothermal vent metagenome TaxID=652676 RepID=A0A3B1D8C6_9ZZZZ